MNQTELLAYVSQHLPAELHLMQTSSYATACPMLSPAEKAIIYHYTDDGYEDLNTALHRAGAAMPPFGQALQATLAKLPVHRGAVYSGAQLDADQLADFALALAHADGPMLVYLDWPAFLSASQSPQAAQQFRSGPGKNCLFLIDSKTGRSIEAVSRYGISEREVLFLPSTRFRVTSVLSATGYAEVVLAEL